MGVTISPGSGRKPQAWDRIPGPAPPTGERLGGAAVRGPRAPARNEEGNCKGKSDTKKRGSFFPSVATHPNSKACQPCGEGSGSQRGLQGPVQGCGVPEGACSGPLCKGLWPSWRGLDPNLWTSKSTSGNKGVSPWRKEDSRTMWHRQAWVRGPGPLLASASPLCSLSLT